MSVPSSAVVFDKAISDHLKVIELLSLQRNVLETIAHKLTDAIRAGGKVLWCGNGGSAADAQHLAAELVGRFRRERRALPSVALTTDSSILTAIGNDYSFDEVFRRQAQALCVPNDVLVGISTSGNSKNVCAAIEMARSKGSFTVAFTGGGEGMMEKIADITLKIDSLDTARIQEGHILCGHMLCDWVELAVNHSEQAAAVGGGR